MFFPHIPTPVWFKTGLDVIFFTDLIELLDPVLKHLCRNSCCDPHITLTLTNYAVTDTRRLITESYREPECRRAAKTCAGVEPQHEKEERKIHFLNKSSRSNILHV